MWLVYLPQTVTACSYDHSCIHTYAAAWWFVYVDIRCTFHCCSRAHCYIALSKRLHATLLSTPTARHCAPIAQSSSSKYDSPLLNALGPLYVDVLTADVTGVGSGTAPSLIGREDT